LILLLVLLLVTAGCARPADPTPARITATPARFKAVDEQTLADQPTETQATFRAAHGAQADEDWNAAHNTAVLDDLERTAVLRASPNPVATRAWAGTTTISFATGSDVVGQVLVSVNGGPEKPFALASAGSQDADWIWRGSTYEFRLYGGTHRERLLRRLTVTRANDAAVSLGGPWLAGLALSLLLASVLARLTSRTRLGRALSVGFAVLSTAMVLWLVLTTPPRGMEEQPFPDAHEYADAAQHLLAGDGYVTTVHAEIASPQPPRYPPGMSLVLAPFVAFGGAFPRSVLSATAWFGVAYVLAAAITAWVIGGPTAAGLTAVLVGSAPFAIESASLVMSDALVAALTVVMAALLQRRMAWLAALLAGGLVLLRLSAALAIPAVVLAGVACPRAQRGEDVRHDVRSSTAWLAHRAARVGLFVLPGLIALAIFQWTTFGSPLRTGYDYWLPDLRTFDLGYLLQRPMGDTPTMVGDALNGRLLGWLCPCPDDGGPLTQLPNVLFYPAVVFGPFWLFAPPLVGVLGLVYAVRHWDEPAARFSVWLTLLSLALMSVYVFQAARLVAAPAVLLAVYFSVAVGRWLEGAARWRWPRRPRR
jgi:hypothetical protein